MWAITMFKVFRVDAHMQEITSVWKVRLGMKHPVCEHYQHFSGPHKHTIVQKLKCYINVQGIPHVGTAFIKNLNIQGG